MKYPQNNERGPHHDKRKRKSYGNRGIKQARIQERRERAYARGAERPKS